ncbi:hypothetical protein OROGR_031544 [Orobanche gracilis]
MGSLILPELGFDYGFSSKVCGRKRTGGGIFSGISRNHGDVSEKISKLEDRANRLRDEMKKIDVFKRELPLCMLLLSDAIVETEDELSQCKKSNSEPVLEEFIPLKKICIDEKVAENNISCRDKMNWMSSVQLWNSDNNQLTLKLDNTKKSSEKEMNRTMMMDNLFQSSKIRTPEKTSVLPFKGCTNFPVVSDLSVGKDKDELPVPALSLCTPESKNSRDGITNPIGFSPQSCSSKSISPCSINSQSNLKTGHHQSARKQRRCWSPKLHRRFIDALQHLGGAKGLSATPKQIRDLMQVDGLTNDEVKSHLQKYRIHSGRLTANPSSSQSVDDMWMAEEHCNESLKQSDTQSGSPEGPLDRSPHDNSGGNEDEEDDEKYEGHHWKGDIRLLSGRDDIDRPPCVLQILREN